VKLGRAIEQVANSERELAAGLLAVRERHPDDQDVFHLAKTLAEKERAHIDALAPHSGRYDANVDGGEGEASLPEPEDPALQLLSDLRQLHLLAAGASLDWVALAQGAQAAEDTELLAAVTECHDETLRTLKWTTYRLKEAAPQALTS
jgi:hypothetical protein